MTTRTLNWELLFRSREMENTLCTIGVAPARDENFYYVSYENSIICSPWGKVLANMGTDEGIHAITLDLTEVTKASNGLPMLKQRRTDVYTLEIK